MRFGWRVYRVGLHQVKGAGDNAVLEAYPAEGDVAFGAPVATFARGGWTSQADQLQVGAQRRT